MDPDHGDRSRTMETDPLANAIGPRRIDPTAFEPMVDQVENALESGRGKAADKACPGREAPVGSYKMLSP
jgi:hypothetical protein